MTRHPRLLFTAAILQTALMPMALADTDLKILSGSLCQPQNPDDRANLHYGFRGVQAVNKDVVIACPIIRDSTKSAINSVDVRYQRGSKIPPQGSQQKDQFKGVFHGTFYSCSNLAAGDADCRHASGSSSGEGDTGDPTRPTSVNIDTKGLPHERERYYAYKAVLPKFAILKSITYQEQDR